MTAILDLLTLRQRAAAFAKEFCKSTYEMGEAQDFIRGQNQLTSKSELFKKKRKKFWMCVQNIQHQH